MTTMTLSTLFLFLFAYATMWSLPRAFFRRDGRQNFRWWITAAPHTIAPYLLVAGYLGWLTPFAPFGPGAARWLDAISVLFGAAAIALEFATVSAHRTPLALWHQRNDAPKEIVTWGPYGRVRHPFYASFLLLMVGTLLAFPHVSTIACFAAALGLFTFTAAGEEKRLLASDFGAEYAAYLKRTGRFPPRLFAEPS
jgi:protein-S-isoprenylcysteine O-methyltransferase Ste14